jgi:radical SAM-linked protein
VKARVRYDKRGKIRFLSHRDLARVWERALRRAGIRVAYSEGFSPRPRLSFGLALSTGYESLGEYLDVDLHPEAGIAPEDLPLLVTPHLPAGMTAQAATALEPGTDSLQAAVTSST